jgi:hypothetical protein
LLRRDGLKLLRQSQAANEKLLARQAILRFRAKWGKLGSNMPEKTSVTGN